jgi:hypothetical protein
MSQGESVRIRHELAAHPELKSVHSADERARRPSRAPDFEAESHALIDLAREMATSPDKIWQKLEICSITRRSSSAADAASDMPLRVFRLLRRCAFLSSDCDRPTGGRLSGGCVPQGPAPARFRAGAPRVRGSS